MGDFRADVIYFLVTDRFFDGDPDNNVGKDDDYDPTRSQWWKYWGGDLEGVIAKLDYLEALGASALWITPVFDQVDGVVAIGGERMAPYHGYWAKDFKRLDEHLVNRPEDVRVMTRSDTVFDKLVHELHRRGMKLVLDIVCNHSNPHMAGGRGELYDDGKLIASYDQDHGSWYRQARAVDNWNDLHQIQTRDLCGLADFNEETYAYRVYIKEAMRGWLDKGVDAFRVDTVKHMPLWFWQEFTGDLEVHKPDLFQFGEWFQGGCWDPASVEFTAKSGMSMLDFAWHNAAVSALARRSSQGMRELVAVVERDHLFRDATELVTFIDNHDVPRFLSLSNDPERFRLAVLLTLVARGVPCLYYGGEQLLHCDTAGGGDPYNRPMMVSFETTPLCRDIATLSLLRRASPAIQKGGMRTKWVDDDRWVFTRNWLGSSVLVAANRGDAVSETVVAGIELPNGSYRDALGGPDLTVEGGKALVRMPARGLAVHAHHAALATGRVPIDVQVHGIHTQPGEDLFLSGDAPELGAWDVERALPMEYVNAATWGTTVAFDASVGGEVHYKFVIRRGTALRREPGRGHHRHVPAKGPAVWRDDWHS
jgi:cyclomaltodextrin glucanotransferase